MTTAAKEQAKVKRRSERPIEARIAQLEGQTRRIRPLQPEPVELAIAVLKRSQIARVKPYVLCVAVHQVVRRRRS